MHLGNQYSSLTMFALQNIRENKLTICVLLCIFKGFLLSLDNFGRHLVLKICWLQKQVS